MASYASKAPGVYVEEVASGGAPISGAGTSTGGLIGILPAGRTMPQNPASGVSYADVGAGVAVDVTSFAEFERAFGSGSDFDLADAVRGFFQNGGTRCFVYGIDPAGLSTTIETEDGSSEDPYGNLGTALEAACAVFEDIDAIALVAAALPAAAVDAKGSIIADKLLTHCEACEDRFAILSGPASTGDISAEALLTSRSSEYGALYFPWIDVNGSGQMRSPVGHLAGAYARTDGSRGVHKAPANVVLSGAYGVAARIGRIKQGPLNQAGVNVIRMFGQSVTVWGARTVAGDSSAFKYVPTRRVYNYIRESVEEGLGWAVFEPNDTALWARIRSSVGAFLTRVWQSGALFGDSADQAFYVKCDADTTPSDVRDLGMVVTEIGVAIVRPAEFVVFRLSQKTGN